MPGRGTVRSGEGSEFAEPAISRGQISHLKSALNLRPDQHPHWARVESALNDLAREKSVAENTTKLRRLKVVAAPLINSLDDSQRSYAIAFARRIGYGRLASSF